MKLGKIARLIEQEFEGVNQDIEGAITKLEEVFIV